MKPTSHHPTHLFENDTWYFVTSGTREKRRYLAVDGHKELVRDRLKSLTVEFKLILSAWVILDNHYHVLIRSNNGVALPSFIRRLHGSISFDLNGRDGTRGRQLWHNYWDTCIRSERDYWVRFNYIHHNPVKHSYVRRSEDWTYSSYRYYLEHKGAEWLSDAFSQYPIRDFTDARDEFER
jgi:putative transposase